MVESDRTNTVVAVGSGAVVSIRRRKFTVYCCQILVLIVIIVVCTEAELEKNPSPPNFRALKHEI